MRVDRSRQHGRPVQRLRPRTESGFTLFELMVVVSIIVLVSAIVVPISRAPYRRDVLNDATLRLEAWLLEVSRKPNAEGQPCTVTFSTGSNRSGGSQLASVSPTTCATEAVLSLPTAQGQTFSVGATSNTVVFTLRNSTTSTSNVDVKLATSSLTALRCVRVVAISGLLRVGRNNSSADVSQTCNSWNVL